MQLFHSRPLGRIREGWINNVKSQMVETLSFIKFILALIRIQMAMGLVI